MVGEIAMGEDAMDIKIRCEGEKLVEITNTLSRESVVVGTDVVKEKGRKLLRAMTIKY